MSTKIIRSRFSQQGIHVVKRRDADYAHGQKMRSSHHRGLISRGEATPSPSARRPLPPPFRCQSSSRLHLSSLIYLETRWVAAAIPHRQTQENDPMLGQCWASVADAGPALSHHWAIFVFSGQPSVQQGNHTGDVLRNRTTKLIQV